MSDDKLQSLKVVIGAGLSSAFNSVFADSTSKVFKLGSAIKALEKSTVVSAGSVASLRNRYNSLLGSVYQSKAINTQRAAFRSQIMDVVALGAALVAPVKMAMEFEKSMTAIKMVVNFPDENSLTRLGDTLTEISTRVPMAAGELAKIAASGGAFGVALKDLPAYSEEVAKTAVAWGLTADQTSKTTGNIMKSFKLTSAELPKYYDAINELGNLTGAGGDEIFTAVSAASPGLSNFKLSLPYVAALTSTIISFGESAEGAGSSFARACRQINVLHMSIHLI